MNNTLIPTSEEINTFKEKYSDFFKLLGSQKDIKISNKQELDENNISFLKDKRGVFLYFTFLNLKFNNKINKKIKLPRVKGIKLNITESYIPSMEYNLDHSELKTLSCDNINIKIKNSNIEDVFIPHSEIQKLEIMSSQIKNLNIRLSRINNVDLKSSIIENIVLINSEINKNKFNNIKNEKFELQESSEIKNLIIIDSTFKEVNIQYGFTDYFKKIEEIEKPEKIAKLPNIIGEFTNVEKLSISPYTNIKNIENYQNLKEFYSFNLNKNLIKINNCPNLKKVDIKDVNNFESITNCPNLNLLEIKYCPKFSKIENCNNITNILFEDVNIRTIKNFPELKRAYINVNNLEEIENCPNLKSLNVNDYYNNYDFKQQTDLLINNCNNIEQLLLTDVNLLTPIDANIYNNLEILLLKNIKNIEILNTFNNVIEVAFENNIQLNTDVNFNNFPNTKKFYVKEKNPKINTSINIKYSTDFFTHSTGEKQKITLSTLSLQDKEKIIQENNGTNLMLKLFKCDKKIENGEENELDIKEINILDNKNLGAAVYCSNERQLKFLFKNNYNFRELEIDLIPNKLKKFYEKYYLKYITQNPLLKLKEKNINNRVVIKKTTI